MKIKKSDLMICYHTEKCYRLSIRKKFFWFFKRWVPITYQEAENSNELPIEFESFEAATDFINNIAEN